MVELKKNPFFLNDEQVRWVEDTLKSMTLEEKAGQLFCPLGMTSDEKTLHHLVCELGVGGMMYRPGVAREIRQTHQRIQSKAKIPLLLAANTEAGGNGLAVEGTSFGQPMAVAATGDPEAAYHMGYVACAEGAALGLNWSFAPVVDIDREFHNPITNTRTFGSNADVVIACASRYMDGADESDVAVAIKHFPGDGMDERDQHIVTSVNTLSCEDWMNADGKVYRALIEKGAKTVMVGHIAQPAWVRRLAPEVSAREALMPATLSKPLMTGLLRGELRFNGVISTDATPMVGFASAMPRRLAIPTAVESGADIILFNKNLDEDYQYLLDGIKNGILTEKRLNEAVTRILALKASLHLPEKQAAGTLVPAEKELEIVGCERFRQWAQQAADQGVTLVHDRQALLPISPKKYKRVYLNVVQRSTDPEDGIVQHWKQLFENEGFMVTVRNRRVTFSPPDFSDPNLPPEKQQMHYELTRSVEEMKKNYDLYVYIVNMQNSSNNTTLRLNWNVMFGMGDDAPWFVSEIPVMMISTACPYHLFDAPMVDTFINAYSATPQITKAVMDKIVGRSQFVGKSPVDPYCGKDYLKW